jgi:hypothetical protein
MTPLQRKYLNYSGTTSGSTPVMKLPQWCKQTWLLEEAGPVGFFSAVPVIC